VFNDPALAIHYFLNQGKRVAYVDIDAHHGDGVQEAFYAEDRVLTISVHESGQWLFPGTGAVSELGEGAGRGYSVNLPLYPYTGDDDYVEAFGQVVPPLIRAFAPDVLVTQLGIDSYHSDPLTHLQVTTEGYIEAVRQLAGLGLPWLALGGGGYDVNAVARAWTLAYGVMLGADWPDQLPPEFVREHGAGRLRDDLKPAIPPDVKVDGRRYLEDTVAAIRQQIFPFHGLGG
jgi:acetoin utilization protein AcuC